MIKEKIHRVHSEKIWKHRNMDEPLIEVDLTVNDGQLKRRNRIYEKSYWEKCIERNEII